jgi:hypothetical protein
MGGLSGLSGLSAGVSGFQQGVGFVQDIQDARQRNKMRRYALNQMGREDTAAQANSEDISDEERAFYGDDTTAAFMPEVGMDPFLYRFMDMMSKRKGKKGKRAQALSGAPGETGVPAPVEAADSGEFVDAPAPAQTMPYVDPQEGVGYADGGGVDFNDPNNLGREPVAPVATQPTITAIPAAGAQPMQNATGVVNTRPMADGGRASKEAEEWRSTRDDRARTGRETVDRSAKPTRTKALPGEKSAAPGKTGFVRGAAAGAGAIAGMAGAIRGYNTPTEDYAERIGLDPSTVGLSFWKDAGIRTAGVLSDVGAAAGDMVGLDLRSRFADVQRQQASPAAAPAQTAMPRTQALPTGSAGAQVAMAAGGARQGAAPAPAPASPQLGDAIDMSQVDIDASELPDIKLSDWKRYRAQALRSARLKGLPQAQALEEADRLVTTMQIRGFSNYAAQSQALLQAGNVKGALRSLRAAYQYFPDGNDVKLGVHKGKIVAVGVDETTGEPFEGGTRVITPEFLAGAIQNFQNPQNFLAWTQDWRQEAFKKKQYEEVTKPLAEAQGQALRTNAEANVARSEAAQLRATMSQRGGGLKPSDMARSEAVYRERLQLLGVTDEAQADQLAAVMSQIKQANPQVPDNMIVDFVMKAQQRPDGMQFIQRALSGQ